jgi:hypothetical protein
MLGQFPSQSEEPEDEDYGFLDWQVPPDFVPDQVPDSLLYMPSEAEEPEDEPFGFDLAPTAEDNDTSADIACVFPAQSEEPEDEDFGFFDFQLPADQVIEEPPTDTRLYFPAEAEEPEDEDFGDFDMQLPEDFVPPVVDITTVGLSSKVREPWREEARKARKKLWGPSEEEEEGSALEDLEEAAEEVFGEPVDVSGLARTIARTVPELEGPAPKSPEDDEDDDWLLLSA